MFTYEFTSVYQYSLIFLKVCGPSFSKGACSAFLVHVNTLWSCIVMFILSCPITCVNLQNALHLGGRVGIFSSEPKSIILHVQMGI